MNPEILRRIVELLDHRVPFAVATVVSATGSVPGKIGARMIVRPDGGQDGTVGGAGLEAKVKELALQAIRTGRSATHRFDLARQKPGGLDSVCGGSVEVFVEYMAPRPHLLIYGGGHVGRAVGRLCEQLEYSYSVADVRPEFASEERFPSARERFGLGPEEFFEQADLARYSHLLVLGHDHHVDEEIVRQALERGFTGRLGVIGSETKRRDFRERCEGRGISTALYDERVVCPIGLPIGAESPDEIAVSILAEVVRDTRTTAP